MTFHYSRPFEGLLDKTNNNTQPLASARVLIVGSGYGGAVAAYRLCGRDAASGGEVQGQPPAYDVMVLERGKEYALGEFPNQLAELPAHVRMRGELPAGGAGNEDALVNIHVGRGVDVVVGSGLGGTSLINANVAARPDREVFSAEHWPEAIVHEIATPKSELNDAYNAVTELLDIVPAGNDARLTSLHKHQALARYSRELGIPAQSAPIAVTLPSGGPPVPNRVGVIQRPCTYCGNCVSGCNVGAKNTLAMNLIPAAHACGAVFFTGATVCYVELLEQLAGSGPRWRVHVQPTSKATRMRRTGTYFVDAESVILAAGTLGSTEILKRSAAFCRLQLSQCLGQRFSTNGDALAMSFGQKRVVDGLGLADYNNVPEDKRCGPTITAYAHGLLDTGRQQDRITLEEGAVPAALVELYGEVLTTVAQIGRLGDNDLPSALKHKRDDPQVVHRHALERSQIFLLMSDDGAAGTLRLEGEVDVARPERSYCVPSWGVKPDPSPSLTRIDRRLGSHDREAALDKGQYVRNPLWKLVPEALEKALELKVGAGRLITVHPLGGCPMGASVTEGVVNDRGEVFNAADGTVYAGLHVLDGSIVPWALTTNPFLTIAALAWRACDPNDPKWRRSDAPAPAGARRFCNNVLQPPVVNRPYCRPNPADAEIVLSERMIGELETVSDSVRNRLRGVFNGCDRWFDRDGLILSLETRPASTEALITGAGPAQLTARLYENPVSEEETRRAHTYGIPSAHLLGLAPIATGSGTVWLMKPDYPAYKELMPRRLAAIHALFERRWRKNTLRRLSIEVLSGLKVFTQMAVMHSTYRRLEYDVTLHAPGDASGHAIRIAGTKVIRYAPGEKQLWQALLELSARVGISSLGFETKSLLRVDMEHLLGDGILRTSADRDVPRALFNTFAFVMRLARSILQSAFWEFGTPEYPTAPLDPKPGLPPRLRNGQLLNTQSLDVSKFKGSTEKIGLQLHRYGDGNGQQGPVLLLHGLAQGSLIFAHRASPQSMAEYFASRGYDVWLLDYRISNQLDITSDGWTMDETGLIDVPAAIDEIWKFYRATRPVHVFAHCVGAVAIAMAVLAQKVEPGRIASIALNAIHPWVVPSAANRVRSKLGVFLRDYIADDNLDPLVAPNPLPPQLMLDAVGFSLARLGEERGDIHDLGENVDLQNDICDRMTFIYGRMWRHENVSSIHGFFKDLLGRAPGSVYRHLHYLLLRRRLVDHEGGNVYLKESNLRNWLGIRTLFIHGEDSDVFNPQSATRSAIRLRRVLRYLETHEKQQNPGTPVPETPVKLRRVQGFGHMDPVFADRAPEHSFRYLDHFFLGHFDASDTHVENGVTLRLDTIDDDHDTHSQASGDAECGPILRAARKIGDKLRLRCWIELPTLNTAPVSGIIVEPQNTPPYYPVAGPAGVEECYQWLDVDLDPGQVPSLRIVGQIGGSGVGVPFATPLTDARWKNLSMRLLGGFARSLRPRSFAGQDLLGWIERLQRPPNPANDCHFIVGSCRYTPLPMDAHNSDRAFAGIDLLLDQDRDCDLVFLIGDQIYADATAGLLDPVSWRDRYLDRYRTVFNSASMKKVLGRIPCHFAVDDHEIANDFAGVPCAGDEPKHRPLRRERDAIDAIRSGDIDTPQLDFARLAAKSYMGAARGTAPFGNSQWNDQYLWYALDHTTEISCPVFVMDTRSERKRACGGSSARLMDPAQLTALQRWLTDVKGYSGPKFIVSGSVVAPLRRDFDHAGMWMREDGIAGYPDELETIVAHIVDNQIGRVVFVGGDLHVSCVAPLTLTKTAGSPQPDVPALQIVSSGLYAPVSFAAFPADEASARRRIALRNFAITYDSHLLTDAPAHFVKVSARPLHNGRWQVSTAAYGPDAVKIRDITTSL